MSNGHRSGRWIPAPTRREKREEAIAVFVYTVLVFAALWLFFEVTK